MQEVPLVGSNTWTLGRKTRVVSTISNPLPHHYRIEQRLTNTNSFSSRFYVMYLECKQTYFFKKRKFSNNKLKNETLGTKTCRQKAHLIREKVH